ncbi:MAG: DUF1622 domain-containing protein [Gammaproteobacteria bacterium]
MSNIGFISSMEIIGNTIDVFGVLVMIIGIIAASIRFIIRLRYENLQTSYVTYRQTVGRSILLGLEFLVAGDIIRTVAVAPSPTNVAVLAGIVVIRTFLSFALQLEVEGRWPWQPMPEKPNP